VSRKAFRGASWDLIRRLGCQLSLLIKSRSDNQDAKNHGAPADKWRDRERFVFSGLQLQIADMGYFLGLLGREYRNRDRDQSEEDQCGSRDDKPAH
jgi:hypothetical protein